MKMEVNENGDIVFRDVFNSIGLVSEDKEQLFICMRDSGFEFVYQGELYYAKEGEVKKAKLSSRGNILVDQSDHGEDDVKTSPCSGFVRDSRTTSATVCLNCGRQKNEHPIM